MAKANGGHRNGSPDAADTLTPTRLAEIGGSIPIAQVQELRKIPSALPSLFPPSRVQNYFLDIASPTSLRLTWATPASNGGSALLGYKIRVVNQDTSATVYQSATYDSSPFVATGLTTGVSYQVRVAPVNAIGQGEEDYSSSIPGATIPGAPTGLSATAGDGTAALSWTAPASDGGGAITGYVVEYTPAGGFAQTSGTGSAGTTFTLNSGNSTVTNGVTYSVRVAATNAAGMGPYSSAVSVTPVAPGGVVFSSVTPDSLNMFSTSSAQDVAPTWSVTGSGTSTLTFSKSYSGLYNQYQNAPFELAFTISGASDCELDLTGIQWASGINGPLGYPVEPRLESVGGAQNQFILNKTGTYIIDIPVGNSTVPAYSRMRLAAGSYKLILNGSKQFPQTSVSWSGSISVKERSTTPAKYINPINLSQWQGAYTNKEVTESMTFGYGGSRNLYWNPYNTATTIRIQSAHPTGGFNNVVLFASSYSAAIESQGWTYDDKDATFSKSITNTNGGYVDVSLPANTQSLIIRQPSNSSTTQLYATILS